MAEKTKNQIIQFIRDCFIPNNTSTSIHQVPDIWKDEIDGELTASENITQIEEYINYAMSNTEKWDSFAHESYYEKYQYMLEKHDFKNKQPQ